MKGKVKIMAVHGEDYNPYRNDLESRLINSNEQLSKAKRRIAELENKYKSKKLSPEGLFRIIGIMVILIFGSLATLLISLGNKLSIITSIGSTFIVFALIAGLGIINIACCWDSLLK